MTVKDSMSHTMVEASGVARAFGVSDVCEPHVRSCMTHDYTRASSLVILAHTTRTLISYEKTLEG